MTTTTCSNSSSSPATSTQPALLERIARNDQSAFNEFIERYRGLLMFLVKRSLGRRLGNAAEADDAMQDVLIALWQAASRFDATRGSETTFITTVARRRLIDRYHRGANRITAVELAVEPEDQRDEGDDLFDQGGETGIATAALANIDPENRHLLELALIHGKSSREIARATGMFTSTVKTRIHRTIKRLRCELGAQLAAA